MNAPTRLRSVSRSQYRSRAGIYTTECPDDLTFLEDCGKDAAGVWTWVCERTMRKGVGRLWVGEHDVRCAEGPERQVGVQGGARGEDPQVSGSSSLQAWSAGGPRTREGERRNGNSARGEMGRDFDANTRDWLSAEQKWDEEAVPTRAVSRGFVWEATDGDGT